MTYITRIATKRILAKYFLYSLKINYLHWKLSASRSVFSCYATFFICLMISDLSFLFSCLRFLVEACWLSSGMFTKRASADVWLRVLFFDRVGRFGVAVVLVFLYFSSSGLWLFSSGSSSNIITVFTWQEEERSLLKPHPMLLCSRKFLFPCSVSRVVKEGANESVRNVYAQLALAHRAVRHSLNLMYSC